MDVIQLLPRLYFLHFPVGHAYLWHDPDGLTLIDTGLPGSAPLIAGAIREAGYQPADLRRLVLTHFHGDHIGAAAEITGWGEVEVFAHRADAPFIRAQEAGPGPDLTDWEQPIYDQVMSQLPPEPVVPPRIDRELDDGDTLSFGDGAVAVAVPGHTARSPAGHVMCGVFNVNRAQAAASLQRLATFDTEVACFGHGEPLTQGAAAELQAAVHRLPADTGQHPRDTPENPT